MGIKEIVTYAIIIFIVLVLIYLPKRAQDKALKKMQQDLKVGDKIITYSGLTGEILQITEEQVIISLSPDKQRLTIEKWAIAGIDDRNKEGC